MTNSTKPHWVKTEWGGGLYFAPSLEGFNTEEKQLNTIQNWMSEKIAETYISVNQDSRECNFANKWLKK